MRVELAEEAVRGRDQDAQVASQATGAHGALHQPPNPLDEVHFMRGVLRQPDHFDLRMSRQPALDYFRALHAHIIHHQDQVVLRIRCHQLLQEGNKGDGQLALLVQLVQSPRLSRQRAEEGPLGIRARRRHAHPWTLHPAGPSRPCSRQRHPSGTAKPLRCPENVDELGCWNPSPSHPPPNAMI